MTLQSVVDFSLGTCNVFVSADVSVTSPRKSYICTTKNNNIDWTKASQKQFILISKTISLVTSSLKREDGPVVHGLPSHRRSQAEAAIS